MSNYCNDRAVLFDEYDSYSQVEVCCERKQGHWGRHHCTSTTVHRDGTATTFSIYWQTKPYTPDEPTDYFSEEVDASDKPQSFHSWDD